MEDLHNKWSHRWITSKAKSFNSKIHGLGVIAIDNIQKGEAVGVLGGIIVPKKEINNYWKIMGHIGIQIDDEFFIVPTTREELGKTGIFNHSCKPNCGFSNQIILIAIKDIKKGEELVLDYAFCESFTEELKCNCSLSNCRKIIRSTDWKIPELQKKYYKYFAPYLKEKIKKLKR